MFWSVNLWGFVMKLVLNLGHLECILVFIAYILTIIYWTVEDHSVLITNLYLIYVISLIHADSLLTYVMANQLTTLCQSTLHFEIATIN